MSCLEKFYFCFFYPPLRNSDHSLKPAKYTNIDSFEDKSRLER